MNNQAILQQVTGAVLKMEVERSPDLVRNSLDAGLSPAQIAEEGLSKGMRTVGDEYRDGDMFMPEVFVACDAIRAIERAGLRDQVKVFCGGPVVDREMAKRMGANDALDNAWDGVERMEAWVAAKKEPS